MALNKSEILDAIAGMTVLELSGLIKDMEEKFGVSAAAAAVAVAAPAGGGAAAAAVEEQTATTNEVSRVIGESKQGVESIASTIREVSAAAVQSAEKCEQTLRSSEVLSGLAEKLKNLVGQVKK